MGLDAYRMRAMCKLRKYQKRLTQSVPTGRPDPVGDEHESSANISLSSELARETGEGRGEVCCTESR